jgi:predicted DNA-binding transcriptional regulator YafY
VAKTQDHILQAAAKDLISKIGDTTQRNPNSLPLSILPHLAPNENIVLPIGPILEAIQAHQKIHLNYQNPHGTSTQRIVWPLQVEMWAKVWTLTAWCELKVDFRVFRLDRIQSIITLDEQFNDEPGRTYQDFLESMKENGPSN